MKMENLEKELRKLGYEKWDSKRKPSTQKDFIHHWYKENGSWKMEYYIKSSKTR